MLYSYFDPILSFKNCDFGFSFHENPRKSYQTGPNERRDKK